jgi:hypothetical protein
LLHRLRISYQRGREWVHSPDPFYWEKLAAIRAAIEEARAAPERVVALFVDELTYYRQPSPEREYALCTETPLAMRAHRANTPTRVVGALNALTAKLCFLQGSRIGVEQLVGLAQQVRESYPQAERLFMIEDNWPVHFHPNLLVALEEQETPFPLPRPANWPTEATAAARRKWGHLHLPIQLLPLPTYASWTNPIEKLWRKLRQEVLYMHLWAEDLMKERQAVHDFLSRYTSGSEELLRYVGLQGTPSFLFPRTLTETSA